MIIKVYLVTGTKNGLCSEWCEDSWTAIYKNETPDGSRMKLTSVRRKHSDFLYHIGVKACFLNTTENPYTTKEKTENWNYPKIPMFAWEVKLNHDKVKKTGRKHLKYISPL